MLSLVWLDFYLQSNPLMYWQNYHLWLHFQLRLSNTYVSILKNNMFLKYLINDGAALILLMVWCRTGDLPLNEPKLSKYYEFVNTVKLP